MPVDRERFSQRTKIDSGRSIQNHHDFPSSNNSREIEPRPHVPSEVTKSVENMVQKDPCEDKFARHKKGRVHVEILKALEQLWKRRGEQSQVNHSGVEKVAVSAASDAIQDA